MKKTNINQYETPQLEIFKIRTDLVLCQSPGGEGGGNDPYNPGGEA